MLDHYGLSKDDFNESLRELQLKVENDSALAGGYADVCFLRVFFTLLLLFVIRSL
jgi:hypothetical protein